MWPDSYGTSQGDISLTLGAVDALAFIIAGSTDRCKYVLPDPLTGASTYCWIHWQVQVHNYCRIHWQVQVSIAGSTDRCKYIIIAGSTDRCKYILPDPLTGASTYCRIHWQVQVHIVGSTDRCKYIIIAGSIDRCKYIIIAGTTDRCVYVLSDPLTGASTYCRIHWHVQVHRLCRQLCLAHFYYI